MKRISILIILLLTITAGIHASRPEEKAYGIVNLSVGNMRSEVDYASELVTQCLLGMPVRIVEGKGWYRIQTPDEYLGWVHGATVHRVTKSELDAWNRAEKVVVTAHYGVVHSKANKKSQIVSDVVGGNRLKYEGKKGRFYKVSYPDGRIGYVHKSVAMRESKWRKGLKQDAASIIETAHTLMGVPYLWGGTSSKGVDCSGFMSNIFFMHDMIIPRDAGPQAQTGERIFINDDFSNLQPGDLIFFGRKATEGKNERVVHVGMYIGDKRFIHSQGDVRISSFDPADALFDKYNLGRLLYASRVLPYINKQEGLNTTTTNKLYNQ